MLKEKIYADVKDAMRAKEKEKLGVLRLITAAIKQIEVDERIDVDDARILVILDKMTKQRKESIAQFTAASRHDLVKQEEYELSIISQYMPEPLSEGEIAQLVAEAIHLIDAKKIADMGRVMAHLKPLAQGRADMNKISQLVKDKLTLLQP